MSLWITLFFAIGGFAANSILCRLAFQENLLDPAIFSSIRLVSGAGLLFIFTHVNQVKAPRQKVNWISAACLFIYVVGFSFAYSQLSVNVGAFVLFAVVQLIFIGWGFSRGQRFSLFGGVGYALAIAGLCYLLYSSHSDIPYDGIILMALAAAAWCIYSLIGRGSSEPLTTTATNFIACVPFACVLAFFNLGSGTITVAGLVLAVASGAYASGVAYVLWYRVLPKLSELQLASSQLSVPILATLGGSFFLGEEITERIIIASVMVASGLYLVWRFARSAGGSTADVP